MKRKTKIKDINSLKLAQMECRAEIAEREASIQIRWNNLWHSVTDLSFFTQGDVSFSSVFDQKISPLSKFLADFLMNNIIKPKSQWVRNVGSYLSSLIIEQYQSFFQFIYKTFFTDHDLESDQNTEQQQPG